MENRDFFISYQSADNLWAEWIAFKLIENEYSVYVQEWDFRPGKNFGNEMHDCIEHSKKMIAVLSKAYLNSPFTRAEWIAKFVDDPTGKEQKLIPVRVEDCEPTGLLKPIVYIDIVGLNEKDATSRLLSGISAQSARLKRKPCFPVTALFPNVLDVTEKISEKFSTILEQEFNTLLERKNNPKIESSSCFLFYGEGFPFGTKTVIPEISKYSLFLDIEKLVGALVGSYKSKVYSGSEEVTPHILYKLATCRWRIYVCAIADGMSVFDSSILLDSLLEGLKVKPVKKPERRLLALTKEYIHYAPNQNKKEKYETSKELLFLLGAIALDNDLELEDLLNEEQRKYRTNSMLQNNAYREQGDLYLLKIFFSDIEGTYDVILNAFSLHNINIMASKSWTFIPDEVAGAELVVRYKGKADFNKELEALMKSEKLCNIFIRYSVEGPNKKIQPTSFGGS